MPERLTDIWQESELSGKPSSEIADAMAKKLIGRELKRSHALHVAAFSRDAYRQAIQGFAQHDLARQTAGTRRPGGEVKHILLALAGGRQPGEIIRIDHHMPGGTGHLPFACSPRSEGRRVGKEGVSTGSSRWWP